MTITGISAHITQTSGMECVISNSSVLLSIVILIWHQTQNSCFPTLETFKPSLRHQVVSSNVQYKHLLNFLLQPYSKTNSASLTKWHNDITAVILILKDCYCMYTLSVYVSCRQCYLILVLVLYMYFRFSYSFRLAAKFVLVSVSVLLLSSFQFWKHCTMCLKIILPIITRTSLFWSIFNIFHCSFPRNFLCPLYSL